MISKQFCIPALLGPSILNLMNQQNKKTPLVTLMTPPLVAKSLDSWGKMNFSNLKGLSDLSWVGFAYKWKCKLKDVRKLLDCGPG